MTDEQYNKAEEILLNKKVKYFDWLRMKGVTPSVYQAIIEAMEAYAQYVNDPMNYDIGTSEFDIAAGIINAKLFEAIEAQLANYEIDLMGELSIEETDKARKKMANLLALKAEAYAQEKVDNMVTAEFHNRILREEGERYVERINALEKENQQLRGLLEESICDGLSKPLEKFKGKYECNCTDCKKKRELLKSK